MGGVRAVNSQEEVEVEEGRSSKQERIEVAFLEIQDVVRNLEVYGDLLLHGENNPDENDKRLEVEVEVKLEPPLAQFLTELPKRMGLLSQRILAVHQKIIEAIHGV